MRKVYLALVCWLAFAVPAYAQLEAAPDGEPTMVAQHAIERAGFQGRVCSLVVSAQRVGDGSIKAICNDQETFRVFSVGGKALAMRCSAARKLGVEGC